MILTIFIAITATILFLLAAGAFFFHQKIKKESELLFTSETTSELIDLNDLEPLPRLLKNYLSRVGVLGKPLKCSAVYKQEGTIKTDPKKDWLSFKATQYVSSTNSGFIWSAKAFPIYIRDRYMEGRGEILVNFLGLRKLVSVSTPETNQSALGRYFGELIWFPIGFLDCDIQWEAVDKTTIKGVMTKGSISVDGYFYFTDDGLIYAFRCKRYRDETLEDFIGEAEEYELMDGLLIPRGIKATWDLKKNPLEYFNATINHYELKK